ncbi:uncharacterized protein LOC131957754 [Physella acuta]|uniref:uncharacterized protein LOC131957754 n=1 Tax=Physella acuta TaxID=109671 RepID=UPI0027DE0DAC|nr:uncharacterized protein LOC131957754 [Physella acuta]
MQWEHRVKFTGQVKTAGMEKHMTWKSGFVDFDFDVASNEWVVKMYFKVNPNNVCQQIRIGKSVSLSVKCGRLIIENKKGDGIHIKLANSDLNVAKKLVTELKNTSPNTPKSNKAEVCVTSNIAVRKGSENVSPYMNGSLSSDSSPHLSSGEISPVQPEAWLSKKTPPSNHLPHTPNNASKRKLDLLPPEKPKSVNRLKHEDSELTDDALLTNRFTGVKDYSRWSQNASHNIPVNNGLGAKQFYGSQNSSAYENSNSRAISKGSQNSSVDRTPRNKRARLSSEMDPDQENVLESSSSLVPVNNNRQSSEENSKHYAEGENASRTVGFDNLGNTCFMNSPLQCLSSLEPLSIDFQSVIAEFGAELKPNSITRLLYLLMKDVRKLDGCPERVRQILQRLRIDINGKFALNTQQDAHELLAELLDRTDEEMKAILRKYEGVTVGVGVVISTTVSPIQANFMWCYKVSFFFHECKTETTSHQEERETTLMLALDSDKDDSLQDCIDRYFESSEVDMKCEKCGKDEKATMTRKIVKRPRIFILNLLRYQTDITETKKKTDRVSIPRYMSIAEYCAADVKAPPHMEPLFMLDRENTLNTSEPAEEDSSPIVSNNPQKKKVARVSAFNQCEAVTVLKNEDDLPLNVESPDVPVHLSVSRPMSGARPKTVAVSKPMSGARPKTPAASKSTSGARSKTARYLKPGKNRRRAYMRSPETSTELDLEDIPKLVNPKDPYGVAFPGETFVFDDRCHPEVLELAKMQKATWNKIQQMDDELEEIRRMNNLNSFSGIINPNNDFYNKALLDRSDLMEPLTIISEDINYLNVHSSTPNISEFQDLLALSPFSGSIDQQHDTAVRTNNMQLLNNIMCSDPALDNKMDIAEAMDKNHTLDDTVPYDFDLPEKQEEMKDEPSGAEAAGNNVALPEGLEESIASDVKRLVKALLSKIWEVQNYMQEVVEDMSDLYAQTQVVITEVSIFVEQMKLGAQALQGEAASPQSQNGYSPENQIAICHTLINRALQSTEDYDADAYMDDEECELIRKEILVKRYSSYKKEDQKVNHLIEDLGLYLAAKKLGIAKPDTPKKHRKNQAASTEEAGEAKDKSVRWKDSEHTDAQDDLRLGQSAALSDDEIFKQDVQCMPESEGAQAQTALRSKKRKTFDNETERSSQKDGEESAWPDEPGLQIDTRASDAADALALALTPQHARAGTSQTEHQYFQSCVSSNTIFGKDVSCYTEEELEKVDPSAMTEDEMLVYAQALSRIEYMREKSAKVGACSPMEVGDSEPRSEQKNLPDVISAEGAAYDGGARSRSNSTNSIPGKGVGANPDKKPPEESKLLICEEDLSDGDEPDGMCSGGKDEEKKTPPLRNTEAKDMIDGLCNTCGHMFCNDCPCCDLLDQADFDGQPLDQGLCIPEPDKAQHKSPEVSKVQPASKVLADRCNTSPENVVPVKKSVSPASTADTKPAAAPVVEKKSPDDHVVPASPLPSPKKDSYLFSPSKPNNLTKTRDYSRLRSPSASPRKRGTKAHSRSASASKKLVFPGEEKAQTPGFAGADCLPGYSDVDLSGNSSLEVNLDDSSYFDHREDCFYTPTPASGSRSVQVSPFTPSVKHNTSTPHTSSTPHPSSIPTFLQPAAKIPSMQKLDSSLLLHPPSDTGFPDPSPVLQNNLSQPEPHEDEAGAGAPSVKPENLVLDKMSDKTKLDKTNIKIKTKRSANSFSSAEEKENDPADQARKKRLDNIEMGKADFSYRLVGIVNHHGESLYAGHYTAFAYNLSKQKWFYMDDRNTKETTESMAKKDSLNSGYMFFYMDKDLFHDYANKVESTVKTSHL